MADILIRGMEMPTEQRVEVLIFKSGHVAYYDVYGRYIGQAKAVPLPEKHGRLIDADVVCKDIVLYRDVETWEAERGNDTQHLERAYGANETLCIVCDAPTIIPAEGGGKDENR
jgi:hypothetical protein